MLDGYKTYALGVCGILWAVGGAVYGKHDWNLAIGEAIVALEIICVRAGWKKK